MRVVLLVLAGLSAAARAAETPSVNVDVNRPKTAFDCDLSIAERWYGSKERCLKDLCVGRDVISINVLDDGRLRKNPCYGRTPSDLER